MIMVWQVHITLTIKQSEKLTIIKFWPLTSYQKLDNFSKMLYSSRMEPLFTLQDLFNRIRMKCEMIPSSFSGRYVPQCRREKSTDSTLLTFSSGDLQSMKCIKTLCKRNATYEQRIMTTVRTVSQKAFDSGWKNLKTIIVTCSYSRTGWPQKKAKLLSIKISLVQHQCDTNQGVTLLWT